jgi:hypothetical protein
MRVALRSIFAILLVSLIVVMVISPYVDLPLTTLRARQAAIRILTVLTLCWAVAAGWYLLLRTERLSSRQVGWHGLHDNDLRGLSSALRC